jgi:hypothetical protein
MVLNVEFIIYCIQILKKINVLKIGQNVFEIKWWNLAQKYFTLKD